MAEDYPLYMIRQWDRLADEFYAIFDDWARSNIYASSIRLIVPVRVAADLSQIFYRNGLPVNGNSYLRLVNSVNAGEDVLDSDFVRIFYDRSIFWELLIRHFHRYDITDRLLAAPLYNDYERYNITFEQYIRLLPTDPRYYRLDLDLFTVLLDRWEENGRGLVDFVETYHTSLR
jgi:hypothetical protein